MVKPTCISTQATLEWARPQKRKELEEKAARLEKKEQADQEKQE